MFLTPRYRGRSSVLARLGSEGLDGLGLGMCMSGPFKV